MPPRCPYCGRYTTDFHNRTCKPTQTQEKPVYIAVSNKPHLSTWGPFETRKEAQAFADAKNERAKRGTTKWAVTRDRGPQDPKRSMAWPRSQEILNPPPRDFEFTHKETEATIVVSAVDEVEARRKLRGVVQVEHFWKLQDAA